ncbi:MAG TPA: hypothetical protein VLH77_05890, partial [Gammaproteobacteria bacterium]|nr:hypothetical protein [Gammaproteobacteria bacterium]
MAWQKVLSKLRTLFNIGKKLFDILDDIWSTLRLYLPQPLVKFITPFVTGGVGFVIYLGETVQGVRAIHRAYKNEKKKGQKKTRLISAIASTVIAASGVGIALSMMAYLLGAAVSTVLVTWSPILVPGLLAGMYSLVLLRRACVFHKAKQEEARDRQALEQFERSEKRDWRLGKGFHYKPIDFEKNRDGFRTEGQYVARQAVLKEKYLASQRRRLNAERKLA